MRHAGTALWLRLFLFLLYLGLSPWALAVQEKHFIEAEVSAPENGSFDVPPSRLDATALPTHWDTHALPYVMPRQITPDAADAQRITMTWFRLRLNGLQPSAETTYLYLPRWQSIGKIAVYADGRQVFRSRGSAVWNGYNHPLWIPLAEPGEAPPREVLIRFDTLASAGGALSTAWVGDESALRPSRDMRATLQSRIPEASGSTAAVLGVLALGIWCCRRKESLYLFFALTALLLALRCMNYYLGPEPLPIPEAWFTWITINSAGWLTLIIYFFIYRVHGRRYPRIEWCLIGAMVLVSLMTLPVIALVPNLASLSSLAYLIIFGELVVVNLVMVFASWGSRSVEGMLLSGWNVLNIPFAYHDWMLLNYMIDIERIYLMPYLIIGNLFFFLLLMLRRYVAAIRDVENVNEHLEEKLAEREVELKDSYAKLRAIEHQQLLSEERRRLMGDMHDGLGFSLTSALAVAEQGTESARVAQVLRECIDDLKLTIDSLEPMDADLTLMLATMRHRLEPRLQAAGIELKWEVQRLPELGWLTPTSVLQVLRILQEAFSNAIRHSGATQIRVSTGAQDDQVRIAVEDNGVGFEIGPAQARGGRGLRNLHKRAGQLSAKMEIESSPGRTCIALHLPLAQAAA